MLRKFADDYNSEKFQREKDYISGCGPYEFVEWVTGQRIKLKKKNNWWGDKLRSEENYLMGFIIYNYFKNLVH